MPSRTIRTPPTAGCGTTTRCTTSRGSAWALSRFHDALDHATFSSARGTLTHDVDPPRQTRLRKLVSRAFTPAAVAALEPAIRALAVRLVEELRAGGGDFVQQLAAVLPLAVISTMLGVPPADRPQVRRWTDLGLERDEDSPLPPPCAMEAMGHNAAYFRDLIAARRRRPGDDLLSRLLDAEVADDDGRPTRLSDGEILGFVVLLSGAGNETVTKLLGNAAVLLARHPQARAALCAEPRRIPAAVEECLRYWPPSQYQGRHLTRDVTLHGVTIPAGSRVLLLTGAACRDEREFPDADAFRIDRSIPIQLAFGHGARKCPGAALARLEARVALEEWLARVPGWEVDDDGLARVHMTSVMGFARMPVRIAA